MNPQLDSLLVTLRPGGDPRPTLPQMRRDVYAVRHEWVREGCRLKSIDPSSELAGEEWAMGPMPVLRHLRLLAQPPGLRPRFPASWYDRCQYPSFQGEIRGGGEPVVSTGGIAVVLGAGNVSAIAATDVLHKVFADGQAVLLKLSPMLAGMEPIFRRAFAALVDAGLLAIVSGGAELGMDACRHPRVSHVHLTGSARTERAIREAVPHKTVTAELGCVTPVIVVPGEWKETELLFQARCVAAMLTSNGGFSCNAAQVLVTCARWPQREQFLAFLRQALEKAPCRAAFYSDAPQRHAAWLREYPAAQVLGKPGSGSVGWTLVTGLDPTTPQRAFREEAFCGVLFETALDDDPGKFFSRAVPWVNEHLWGDLSCSVIAHPAQQAEPSFDETLHGLRYGSVGVNLPPSLLYALIQFPWGAFPALNSVSGRGWVHNVSGIPGAAQGILRGPFWHPLRMPWQVGYTRMRGLLEAVTEFEFRPSWARLLWGHVHFFRGALRW
jgi:hypothetical protein